jgi:malonate-semialdehyde dehydrogenase (acetylating)/methylmalonate-semialdehyde dehydrogenase
MQLTHLIAGRPAAFPAGEFGDVFNPSTGEVIARVPLGTAAEVDAAVRAAQAAFAGWSNTPAPKRATVLFRYREVLEQHFDELARLVTRENGKTLDEARGDVRRGIEVVEFACGIAHLAKGESLPQVAEQIDAVTMREPLGVCAGITPFNFPAMVPMWMYPLAIACGNAFILKPSEKDPSAALLAGELLAEAGLPDGVFNVVHGDKTAVDAILEHPGIAAVSFVGSTPIARHVYETGTRAGKRVQALGGAKNHLVVLPDADCDLAADAAVSAAYGSTGQRCMAVSVVVTVGDAADRLVPRLRERLARLRVAPGRDANADMGPLVTSEARARVLSYVERGQAEGAELVVDGREVAIPGHEAGFFVGPCLFDRVTPGMAIYTDEIFGPVLAIVRAGSYDEALALVNRNRYANGVAIFTNDGGAARRFQAEVHVGMVGINVPIPVPMAYYSFGGWKESLFGDAHVHGREGVQFYTRGKVVTSRWPDPSHRGVNLGFPQAK